MYPQIKYITDPPVTSRTLRASMRCSLSEHYPRETQTRRSESRSCWGRCISRMLFVFCCKNMVAIFYTFSQFCEIDISLLSLQTQPNTAPNLFQRGVEYGKYEERVSVTTIKLTTLLLVIVKLLYYYLLWGSSPPAGSRWGGRYRARGGDTGGGL